MSIRHWNALTPQERDYDRMVAGKIPAGASWALETREAQDEWDRRASQREDEGIDGCSCHLHPPCSYCVGVAREN